MLGSDDVGHRVVVRRKVGSHGGRPLMSDALGTLTAVDDDTLTVATDAGPVTIALSDIIAAKRVPPRPTFPRRS